MNHGGTKRIIAAGIVVASTVATIVGRHVMMIVHLHVLDWHHFYPSIGSTLDAELRSFFLIPSFSCEYLSRVYFYIL